MTTNEAKRPLCRYCGKPIAKATRQKYVATEGSLHGQPSWVDHVASATPVKDKASAQRLFNEEVVSVGYADDPAHGRIVYKVNVWDGSSYVDPYFCNGEHAKRFAYVCAREGRMTAACADALRERSNRKASR